jgi:hypothetical protein
MGSRSFFEAARRAACLAGIAGMAVWLLAVPGPGAGAPGAPRGGGRAPPVSKSPRRLFALSLFQ